MRVAWLLLLCRGLAFTPLAPPTRRSPGCLVISRRSGGCTSRGQVKLASTSEDEAAECEAYWAKYNTSWAGALLTLDLRAASEAGELPSQYTPPTDESPAARARWATATLAAAREEGSPLQLRRRYRGLRAPQLMPRWRSIGRRRATAESYGVFEKALERADLRAASLRSLYDETLSIDGGQLDTWLTVALLDEFESELKLMRFETRDAELSAARSAARLELAQSGRDVSWACSELGLPAATAEDVVLDAYVLTLADRLLKAKRRRALLERAAAPVGVALLLTWFLFLRPPENPLDEILMGALPQGDGGII